MKVTEHLDRASDPFITFEIIPPTRGGDLPSLLGLIEDLMAHQPPFIDITSHAAEVVYEESVTGYEKRIKRKRPGTLGVCALIQNKFDVDAVPHILCEGFTREETEDFLIELRYLDIDNVLAIRGDSSGYEKRLDHGRSRNVYATDLISQITEMNKGMYLEDLLDAAPTNFCIGAAGYPEKHFEAPNLQADVARVKQKVDAGAEYVVTQMFFDNAHYFTFVDECRRQGVVVPIIPGLKVLGSQQQSVSIPRTFHCEIPPALAEAVAADPDSAANIGIEWATAQTRELLEAGVPSVHFYVMQSAKLVNGVLAHIDV